MILDDIKQHIEETELSFLIGAGFSKNISPKYLSWDGLLSDQILSSFAISVAANIATALFARNNTEKEIRKAFQEAIEMWCPNEDIRRHREPFIYNFVNEYIANPALDFSELTEEQRSFLQCFEKCVANHHSASLYLSAIKEKEYYDIVMASLNRVHSKLDDISKKLDEANPRNEELHFEAVAQINTVLKEIVEDPVYSASHCLNHRLFELEWFSFAG